MGTLASGGALAGSPATMSGADGEPDEAVFTQLQQHGDFFFDTVGVSVLIL